MEESLDRLADKFEMLISKGLLLQMEYEDGTVTFPELMDHVRVVQKVQGEIENLMILQVTRFYGRCKVLRDKKSSMELKSDEKKIISQLGFPEEVSDATPPT